MSETNELYSAVHYIKNKVDTLEKIEILRMRTDKVLKQKYIDFFNGDNIVLVVYKTIDGFKDQHDIANVLDLNDMKISRTIKKLEDEGLIEFIQMKGKSKIYTHTVVEKAYHFCKIL